MLRRTRNTYQNGWIETRPSKKQGLIFVYRWRARRPDGGYEKRTEPIGPVSVLKTETNAWRAVEHRRLEINSEDSKRETVTMNAVISRYLEEELPELRHSTADAYRSYLVNHIKPRWGDHPVRKMKPLGVELWLKQLALAPKTKGHLQNLLRVLFNCAMRWELVDIRENPMKLVRVRGGSKRTKEPKVLTIPQFQQLVQELNDPYRTMVILDLATGLRCSELFALKWCDVIWDDLTLLVRRGIVDTVVSDVKTEYSRAGMPLDPALAEVLLNWQRMTKFNKAEDWIFASPFKAGTMPWQPWRVQQRHIAPAAVRCGIGHIGWHTFRHTFRSLLDETGAPLKVQQEHIRQGHGEEQARGARQSRSSRIGVSGGLVPPYCPREFLSR